MSLMQKNHWKKRNRGKLLSSSSSSSSCRSYHRLSSSSSSSSSSYRSGETTQDKKTVFLLLAMKLIRHDAMINYHLIAATYLIFQPVIIEGNIIDILCIGEETNETTTLLPCKNNQWLNCNGALWTRVRTSGYSRAELKSNESVADVSELFFFFFFFFFFLSFLSSSFFFFFFFFFLSFCKDCKKTRQKKYA